MLITNIDNTNFTSRNADIRFADRIAREVNVQFPTLSLSIANRYNLRDKVPKFHHGESKSWEKSYKCSRAISKIFCTKKKNYTKFNEYINVIKKYKMADCFDRSMLALLMARCSGLKNCSIRGLCGKQDGWLDHAVVYVADKKNPYIIDPWLGFADYLPKAFERYSGEYSDFFIRLYFGGQNGDLYLKKHSAKEFPAQSLITDRILTPHAMEKFAKTRPELFLRGIPQGKSQGQISE